MRCDAKPTMNAGGSKIFENYTAKIKERSSNINKNQHLQVPQSDNNKRGSLNDLNEDPDLGDSSRFTRRSKIRSTWSAGRRGSDTEGAANKKELKLFQKIGKLFSGK